ncbi:amino acid ABC transporter substrate-binding protein [Pandoraea anhela]|uniref:ABC transporter n=1 Tax=Pandoraea anhela TaxID=2508295 RepID=A0A5E4WBT1_9BURK|nr:amino acid ABC transporter substrate-binding protein [Pandoraea anhela]VVE22068.1 ABC transporter [Pandoraea anhela]
MKLNTRILAGILCFVSSFGALGTAHAKSATLEKIRDTGTLTLGYRESSVPFSYLGTGQKPVGFSMDLCAAVADHVKKALNLPNLKVATIPVSPANRIPLLQNGTIDIECGSTTNTADRQKQVAFSVAIFAGAPTWVTLASSNIRAQSDLRGKTVVLTQGSLNQGIAAQTNVDDKLGLTILQTKDHAESLLMLRTGRATAWFEDNILEAGLVSSAPDPKAFRYVENPRVPIYYYGLMLAKGDPEFKALVDDTLKSLMSSGEFKQRYLKWFTQPIPPNGQNLALPMGAALEKRVASPSDSLDP